MTYSHALDLAICHAVLRRGDFGHLGLIGSATKRARFLTRLRELGIAAGGARAPDLPDRPARPRRQGARHDRRRGRRPAGAARDRRPRRRRPAIALACGGRSADDRRRCSSCKASPSAFPACSPTTTSTFAVGARRDPRAARRERRRQVDAGQDDLRRAAPRRGRHALRRRALRARTSPRGARAMASAWCSSTSRCSRR